MRTTHTLGLDVGGTKLEAVVLELPSGRELARRRVATDRHDGYDAVVARTVDLARDTAALAGIPLTDLAVGAGMPGSITAHGLVKNSNTVCLNGRPFRRDVERALAAPVAWDNDANTFALAEALLGAGAPYSAGVVFGVILGTGVGGGIVIDGRVWRGPQGIAGEWGHHAVWAGAADARPCYCGQRGCVEAYASGPAVEAEYVRRGGEPSSLAAIVARREHDAAAAAAVQTLLETFGRAVANVIDVLDPSAVVLGGGVSHVAALYTEGRAAVAARVFNDELTTPILPNLLGDSAGVLGAALLAAPREALPRALAARALG